MNESLTALEFIGSAAALTYGLGLNLFPQKRANKEADAERVSNRSRSLQRSLVSNYFSDRDLSRAPAPHAVTSLQPQSDELVASASANATRSEPVLLSAQAHSKRAMVEARLFDILAHRYGQVTRVEHVNWTDDLFTPVAARWQVHSTDSMMPDWFLSADFFRRGPNVAAQTALDQFDVIAIFLKANLGAHALSERDLLRLREIAPARDLDDAGGQISLLRGIDFHDAMDESKLTAVLDLWCAHLVSLASLLDEIRTLGSTS